MCAKANLADFTRDMLDEKQFPGIDACVAFVPDGEAPSARLKAALDQASQSRWYPVSGGHEVKVPFFYVGGFEDVFRIQVKGWDHEHCDTCGASIPIGGSCWTTREANFSVLCPDCYSKLEAPSG